MNYYISDLHLEHKNVIVFDNRPVETIEENNMTIIDNWNSAVGMDDDVYLLGDISWSNSTKTLEIFNNLNGNIHLIRGNHDAKILKNRKLQERFCEIVDYKELTDDSGKGLILCHYPLLTFKNHYYGWWHFYGHVHNTWEHDFVEFARKQSIETSGAPLNMINVGCMMPWMNYTPKTFTEIIDAYNKYNEGDA